MYRSIIIDDEPKLREVLKIKIENHCPDIIIVGTGANIKEAKLLIETESPDIIFLDIEMPGGSGFDLLESLDEISFQIIFVTGYNDYAIDALRLSAVDYLLKPLKTLDLTSAVNKAVERIKNSEIIENYSVLKQNINNTGDQSMKVGIPNNDTYEFVQVKDIIRCEGWNKYTKVYQIDGSIITSSYNIGTFKEMLVDYGYYSTYHQIEI